VLVFVYTRANPRYVPERAEWSDGKAEGVLEYAQPKIGYACQAMTYRLTWPFLVRQPYTHEKLLRDRNPPVSCGCSFEAELSIPQTELNEHQIVQSGWRSAKGQGQSRIPYGLVQQMSVIQQELSRAMFDVCPVSGRFVPG